MSQAQQDDPQKWIREPTDAVHGVRLVDHDGTVFIEQIDADGNKVQSVMITETAAFIEAAGWFINCHKEP